MKACAIWARWVVPKSEARGVSANGNVIVSVGAGKNGATGRIEAFLLDTWRSGDTNGDGCVDDADLLTVLFNFGNGC